MKLITSQKIHATTHIGHFGSSSEEVQRKRTPELKLEGLQNHLLHLQNLSLCKGVVSDVGEVSDLWSVHLLVFTGHQHGGHTDELQLPARDRLDLQHRGKVFTQLTKPRDRKIKLLRPFSPGGIDPGLQL